MTSASEIWIDQSAFTMQEKLYFPDSYMFVKKKALKLAHSSHWRLCRSVVLSVFLFLSVNL